MIERATVEQILEKVNIAEVISEFMPLQKKGKYYWGVCSYHSHNNTLFGISPKKNIFWCLYCGEKGNAIDFLRRYRKLTQDESIRFLAKNIP